MGNDFYDKVEAERNKILSGRRENLIKEVARRQLDLEENGGTVDVEIKSPISIMYSIFVIILAVIGLIPCVAFGYLMFRLFSAIGSY
jgi:hypothetical protein